MLRHLSFKALTIGFLVDLVGSTLAGIGFGIFIAVYEMHQGVPLKNLESTAYTNALIYSHAGLFLSVLFMGLGMDFLGGVCTGIFVQRAFWLRNAVALALLEVLLGVLYNVASPEPLWAFGLFIVSTPLIAILGVKVGALIPISNAVRGERPEV